MAYAAHHARLSAARPDGSTDRDHWQAIVNRGPNGRNRSQYPKARAKLDGPAFPAELTRVWSWYLELRSAQRVGMVGVEPITFTDVKHWSELTGRTIEPYQVRLIMGLDSLVRDESAPKKAAKTTDDTATEALKEKGRRRG